MRKKELVTTKELAKQMKVTYQSAYLKMRRDKIKPLRVKYKDGSIVKGFTKEVVKKLLETTAKPLTNKVVSIMDVEKKFKITRPTILKALKELKIKTLRCHKKKGNYQISVIPKQDIKKLSKYF